MPAIPRTHLPPRLLPILYFAVAHVALALACLAVAVDPRGVSGFFYHSRMLAIVHLVTLGWITTSILGSLYIVGPIALRMWIPATWLDYTAFACVLVGVVGMVAHFWLQEYGGMAWSAITVGVRHHRWSACTSQRPAPCVAAARHQRAHHARVSQHPGRRHTRRAHRVRQGLSLSAWVRARQRLRPRAPGRARVGGDDGGGRRVSAAADDPARGDAQRAASSGSARCCLRPAWSACSSRCCCAARSSGLLRSSSSAGFAAFIWQVVWMLRRPRPRPPGLRRPDPAVLHAGASFAVAGASRQRSASGSRSQSLPPTTLRVAMAYGVFGLVGFLAQIVVGMEGRLLPIFAWYWAYANTGYKGPVPSQHDDALAHGQEVAFVLWLSGVPMLAVSLAYDLAPLVSAGGWCLLAATLLDTINIGNILRHAFLTPGHLSAVNS